MKCTLCGLCRGRKNIVLGGGNPNADIFLIGEAPGRKEDETGVPFSGVSGMLLDKLLESIFLSRQNVYVTNLVKCRPPDNRDPLPEEIEACLPHLRAEMAQGHKLYVLMGRHAASAFLPGAGMRKVHGIPFAVREGTVLPVFHPAAGVYEPSRILNLRDDFQKIPQVLKKKIIPREYSNGSSDGTYSLVSGREELLHDIDRCGSGIVAVDTETRPDGSMWCLSYSIEAGTGKVIKASQTDEIDLFGAWVGHTKGPLTVVHNALFDIPVLRDAGVFPAEVRDTMVMAYLLQTEPQGLKPLAYRHCNMAMSDYSEVIREYTGKKAMEYLCRVVSVKWDPPPPVQYRAGKEIKFRQPQTIDRKARRIIIDSLTKGADPWARWHRIKEEDGRGQAESLLGKMPAADLSDADTDTAVSYAARDADASYRIYPILWSGIKKLGMQDVFKADMEIIPMVTDMMKYGIRIDKDMFRKLSETFRQRMSELEGSIQKTAGEYINPASSQQTAELLYDRLKVLRPDKHGKRTTASGTLASIADSCPAADSIIKYREYNKLVGTYAEAVPALAVEYPPGEWRVHASFRTTRTVTGRLSASDPNLMAQPVRSAEGREIRKCYIPSDGCAFLSVDYSQVEMRVAAHASEDSMMIKIISEGQDIHTLTAATIFNLPPEKVDKKLHRYPAKSVGFGVLYGIGPQGLQRQLIQGGADQKYWTLDRCTDLISKWFGMYKGVSRYMKRNTFSAANRGIVRDMWGRVRQVPAAMSPVRSVAERAVRQACNDPVQGGAQGVIKRAMSRLTPLYKEYEKRGRIFRPLIQIHDDIVFEIEKELLSEAVPRIVDIMENIPPFTEDSAGFRGIRLKTDPKAGERWGSLEDWGG